MLFTSVTACSRISFNFPNFGGCQVPGILQIFLHKRSSVSAIANLPCSSRCGPDHSAPRCRSPASSCAPRCCRRDRGPSSCHRKSRKLSVSETNDTIYIYVHECHRIVSIFMCFKRVKIPAARRSLHSKFQATLDTCVGDQTL